MIKKTYFTAFAILAFATISPAQQLGLKQQVEVAFSIIPQEKVYVHYNTPLLFAGEYLYYKFYCMNAQTNEMSRVSKIGYVTLVSNRNETVFTHKIDLVNGLGQGDYFIPTTVPTGQYKLLAYTQWMQNEGIDYFYQDDVNIINPYKSTEIEFLEGGDTKEATMLKDLNIAETQRNNSATVKTTMAFGYLNPTYGKRENVKMALEGIDEEITEGNYSVSVRKIDSINFLSRYSAIDFFGRDRRERKIKINSTKIHLPELRGDLLSGQVVSNVNGKPLPGGKVALSIPGSNYTFKVASCDDNGIFHFNLYKDYEKVNAYVQLLVGSSEEARIVLDDEASLDYTKLSFTNGFRISSDLETHIVDRSVYNQVENAYFTIKPDTILEAKINHPFYGLLATSYNLDDYTRFKTSKEVFVEIINNAWLSQDNDGNKVFRIREKDPTNDSKLLPLLLIDGILVQDHQELIDYDARKIQHIHIVRDKYYLGSQVFQGIISIETIDSQYSQRFSNSRVMTIELTQPQQRKKYFNQIYKDDSNTRVPDFRSQLFWEPNFNIEDTWTEIEFYTSDNIGNYEICLEGFTNSGKPITLKKIFSVR